MKTKIATLIVVSCQLLSLNFAQAREEQIADAAMCRGLDRQSSQLAYELNAELQDGIRQYENLNQILAANAEAAAQADDEIQSSNAEEKSFIDATVYADFQNLIKRAQSRIQMLNELCGDQQLNSAKELKQFIEATKERLKTIGVKSV